MEYRRYDRLADRVYNADRRMLADLVVADALAAAGAAIYAIDEGDRRKQRIELTSHGEETLGQLPAAEFIAATEALGHFKAVVPADSQSMKRQGMRHGYGEHRADHGGK